MWRNLWNKPSPFLSLVFILLSLALRLYLSTLPAQIYDIGTYEAWGRVMLAKGPGDFFNSTWSDYLPLPIYFCSLIVLLADYLRASYGLVFKLATSMLELILLSFIWQNTKAKFKSLLFPLLILSPALLGDSAWWGQLDTLPSLLTVFSLLLINNKPSRSHLLVGSVIFGLAVSFKPIMLITLPVFLLLFLTMHKSLKNLLIFVILSFTTFLLPALPLGGNPFSFLVSKALEQSSTYPYTTINAWNFWSLIPLHNSWPPDNQSVLSVSAHSLGLFLYGLFTFLTLHKWRLRGFHSREAFRVAALLLITFYVFTTRMHERHLFFGLPFLALAALTDYWLIIPLTLLAFTFTANLWSAYYWVNHNQTWPLPASFIQALSLLNVLTTIFIAFVWDLRSLLLKAKAWLSQNKIFLAIILLALFLRLYGLSYPSAYIFDEVYHSFTARELIHNNVEAWEWWTTPPPGVAYEWTHPPLAKYGMVVGMLLFGENSFGWRLGSSVMGIVSIIGLYYLVLAVFKKKSIALLASFLLTIEGLHLSQSRVGMNDLYMLALLIWSLYNAVKSKWKVTAILYGLALSSKWSALYGLIPLGLIYLHEYWADLSSAKQIVLHLLRVIRLVLISLIVYVLSFMPFLLAGHTWAQWWELHRQMWYYHTHLVATHAYQSTPYQWLFMLRPVWYFVQYGAKVSNIYAQGNPAILWLGLAAFLLTLPKFRKFSYLLFLTLYLVFTLPWVFSPRIMFFYHYLPSSAFLTVILAAWLEEFSPRTRSLFLLLCALSFIILSPVYFGFPMPMAYWDTLFGLFPSWK